MWGEWAAGWGPQFWADAWKDCGAVEDEAREWYSVYGEDIAGEEDEAGRGAAIYQWQFQIVNCF